MHRDGGHLRARRGGLVDCYPAQCRARTSPTSPTRRSSTSATPPICVPSSRPSARLRGERRSTGSTITRRPPDPRRGLPAGARARFFGPTGRPAPAPAPGVPGRGALAEFRERVAPLTFNAQHPGFVQLLHAAAARDVDRRRGAGAVAPPGCRRLARRPGRGRSWRRRSSAGSSTSWAPAGRVGRADLGRA